MFFFKYYTQTVIKYDLINSFCYTNIKEIPKLEKIILNFGLQKPNFKQLISSLLALELISSKKGNLTKSKHVNILLKIKKGNPVGCKVILKKDLMYSFYIKLITSIYPKIKQLQTNQQKKSFKIANAISFRVPNALLFAELENQYQFFKDVPSLDITISTSSKSGKELFFY